MRAVWEFVVARSGHIFPLRFSFNREFSFKREFSFNREFLSLYDYYEVRVKFLKSALALL